MDFQIFPSVTLVPMYIRCYRTHL